MLVPLEKTTVLGTAHSGDFVILAYTVLIQFQSVTDAQAIAKMRKTFCISIARYDKQHVRAYLQLLSC